MWQHDQALQLAVMQRDGGGLNSFGSSQAVDLTFAQQPTAQLQGAACSMDVSSLKAVLQDLLGSLPFPQPASTGIAHNSSAAGQQLLQGPCAVLGMSQPSTHMQPQPVQQVLITPSGQQVLLLGGNQHMPMQHGAVHACAAQEGGCGQVLQVLSPSDVPLAAASGQQHVQLLVGAPAGQESQVTHVLVGSQVRRLGCGRVVPTHLGQWYHQASSHPYAGLPQV